ncbi:MAG: hypothetical protein K6F39_00040 [Lachnospiraceae bacterium]|nr:hypothetical protein [Lachnospiraceae bacterium]
MRRKSINAALAIAIAASMMTGTQAFAAEAVDPQASYEEVDEKVISNSDYAWCIDDNGNFVAYVTPEDYEGFKAKKDLITLRTRGKNRHFEMKFDDEAKQVTFKMNRGGLGRGGCYVIIGYGEDAICFWVNIGGNPAIPEKPKFDKDVNLYRAWGKDLLLNRDGERIRECFSTTDDGKTYYTDENGEICKNVTKLINGQYYGFDQDGVIRCDEFVKSWGKLCYFNEDGVRMYDTYFEVDGKGYYADKNGELVKNKVVEIDGVKHWFGKDYVMVK